MTKVGEIPYTWMQIEREIKLALQAQASILANFGPRHSLAALAEYLGVPLDQADAETEDFDITRHSLYTITKTAYEYAYQLDGCEEKPEDVWYETIGVLSGFPQADFDGNPSPLHPTHDFALRRVFETFFARYTLFNDEGFTPSIRDLALLSNMTVAAVRNSLSKEGLRLEKGTWFANRNQEGGNLGLSSSNAKLWLSKRRGFIPQKATSEAERVQERIALVLSDDSLEFPVAVLKALELSGYKPAEVVAGSPAHLQWLDDLLAGRPVAPDITLLKELALLLDTPEPKFVARGVEHILSLEATTQRQA